MDLELIKSNTTWNDASHGINSNFEKVRLALLDMGDASPNLAGLSDVLLEGLSEDQIIVWDGYAWKNVDIKDVAPEPDLSEYAKIAWVESGFAQKTELEDVLQFFNKIFHIHYIDDDPQKGIASIEALASIWSRGNLSALGYEISEDSGDMEGTLASLLDVSLNFVSDPPTEENRQVLTYDTMESAWVNKRTMYKHIQGDALSEWTISHGLNKMPNIKVIDSTGEQVYGSVRLIDMNTVSIAFGGAFSGTAYLD